MCAFDKIIGYETIKQELKQICDMIHNPDIYQSLGAKLPHGLLLYGEPGLGKSLMSQCFMEESGLETYTIRRNKNSNDFIGEITRIFQTAKEHAPAVVFLDDIDKFANEDERHRDAEEYVSIQAGIDEVSNSDVFVLATANDIDKLPDSLIRLGRFDRHIEVCCPTPEDATLIIQHYLKTKKVAPDVNLEDVSMMISYSSCAELETILNEAAITAAYSRKTQISMDDITNAVLRNHYEAPDEYVTMPEDERQRVALHEAGHLVVSEVLCPGSVGIASMRASGREHNRGFIRRCKDFTRRPYHILVSLAGKAAVELYYSDTCASGCQSDIHRATKQIRYAISDSGTNGLGQIDLRCSNFRNLSEGWTERNEAIVHAELERYLYKARDILIKNREFLEKAAAALVEKETLLYSDIRALRDSVKIVHVEV